MGLLKTLKKLTETSPRYKQEKQERQNRRAMLETKKKEAYQQAYEKATIQRAQREGHKKGASGGSGFNLGSIGRGLGDFSRASERTMELMVGDIGGSSFRPQSHKRKTSGTRPIRIIVTQNGQRKHKPKKPEQRQWWEL
jgi:hypothetical protein